MFIYFNGDIWDSDDSPWSFREEEQGWTSSHWLKYPISWGFRLHEKKLMLGFIWNVGWFVAHMHGVYIYIYEFDLVYMLWYTCAMFKKMDYIPTLGDAHEIMFIEIHIYYIYYIYISISIYLYIYIIYISIYIYIIYIYLYIENSKFFGASHAMTCTTRNPGGQESLAPDPWRRNLTESFPKVLSH